MKKEKNKIEKKHSRPTKRKKNLKIPKQINNNNDRIDFVHFKFDFEFLSIFYRENSSSHRRT